MKILLLLLLLLLYAWGSKKTAPSGWLCISAIRNFYDLIACFQKHTLEYQTCSLVIFNFGVRFFVLLQISIELQSKFINMLIETTFKEDLFHPGFLWCFFSSLVMSSPISWMWSEHVCASNCRSLLLINSIAVEKLILDGKCAKLFTSDYVSCAVVWHIMPSTVWQWSMGVVVVGTFFGYWSKVFLLSYMMNEPRNSDKQIQTKTDQNLSRDRLVRLHVSKGNQIHEERP